MPWAVAAAAIGVAGSIGSAVIGSNAAEDAAEQQAAATRAASAEREKAFGEARGYLDPYATLGTESLPTLKGLLGLGEGGAGDMTGILEKYPGYQFALSQGQKAIGNQQQAAGARYSGNALKAASDYAQQMGYGVFSDYFDKIMGVNRTGLTAATGIANAAIGKGTSIAGDRLDEGNARAAGTVGSANAWAGGISGSANAIGGALGNTGFQQWTGFGSGNTGGWSGTAKDIIDNA